MHTVQKYALNLRQDILTSEKSALNLGQDIPTSGKSALNLGHISAPCAKVCPESGSRFSDPGKVCPESEARFCPLCRSMNQIQGKVSPPWGWLARIFWHKKTSSEWLWHSKDMKKPHENQNKLIYFKNNVYLCTRYY